MTDLQFFAPCTKGAEQVLAAELRALGMREVRQVRAGAAAVGSLKDGYTVLLWSRVASRLLLRLGDVDCSSAEALYEGVRRIPWEEHMRADGTLAVDAAGMNDALRNTQFTAVKVKDAVADRFRQRFGRRPSVDTASPDLRINVLVRGAKASISIDLAGEPLHRRGYRTPGEQVGAPLKETLAATMLLFAGWRGIAERGGAFVDPLCGSGTLAIEAALIAADAAPGLTRRTWGFSRWLGHDAEAWSDLREEAADRREAGVAKLPAIIAGDIDPRAVDLARSCVRRAGLEGNVTIERRHLAETTAPPQARAGLVATNPPWGERLSERAALPELYAGLSERLTEQFRGWKLAVITPDERLADAIGLQPNRAMELASGPKMTRVSVFDVSTPVPAQPAPTGVEAAMSLDSGAEAFANRLRKMSKHSAKWARRTGVTCYRIYDADLPDYAVVVDRYEGAGDSAGRSWAHVAEYAAPSEVDEQKAEQRLEAVRIVVPEVLGIDADNVHIKRRERQRGDKQYEREARKGATGVVSENGLLFEINLSDYLDTGLFLDHRDTRAWIRDLSSDKRFLNLFAYTGTASVYAASGGAALTTTVDLSATYLDWAARNMALNGFTGPQHERVRADVLEWLGGSKPAKPYDLIFVDPPTFSTSKRMSETFDVQRDHARVIEGASRMMAADGAMLFSCNRRRFSLDEERLAEAGLAARDVTARTIPKDFERTPWVHRCWMITHAGADDSSGG